MKNVLGGFIILVSLPLLAWSIYVEFVFLGEAKGKYNTVMTTAAEKYSESTADTEKRYKDKKETITKNYKVLKKNHFHFSIDDVFASLIEITDKNMHQLLELCSVMISSTSSACVEAVSVGIPVAIYGNRYGVTLNPIPENVPNEIWEVFYTKSQLVLFINQALVKKSRHSIVNDLFHPISREGARELFTLP